MAKKRKMEIRPSTAGATQLSESDLEEVQGGVNPGTPEERTAVLQKNAGAQIGQFEQKVQKVR